MNQLILHVFFVFTNWLPDNVKFIRLRGFLFGLCMKRSGKRLGIGRNVYIYNCKNLEVGDDVYIAYGTWMNALGQIHIHDQVLIGPYCVLASTNHSYVESQDSYRFGPSEGKKIVIERGAWLGAHITVTAGVTIAKASVIAANSSVVKDTEPNSINGGVPSKRIK